MVIQSMIAPARNTGSLRGFSLVELLVAMAIGLLLTLLVASLFAGSRSTNQTTDEVSRMQESIRFADQLLSRSIRHAGYRSDPSANAALLFTAGTPVITGTEGSGSNADTFTVSFQGNGNGGGAGDSSIVDCLGRSFDQNVTVTNTFFIANGANGALALWCTSTGGLVTQTAEVVPDVQNMQVLYGEDGATGTADGVVDRFVPITAANPNNIIAVRVGLLFSTTNVAAGAAGTSAARTDVGPASYTVNGTVVPIVPPDRQLRRAVTWNINMRNRTRF